MKVLIDRGCFERGCACHDSRIDEDPVEVVVKRTWVGLSDVNAVELWQLARHDIVEFARAIEAKLKEKNT
jgi:hypothetical protein